MPQPPLGPGSSPNVEAIIFIGGQGSGKSSFYREKFFDTHIRINLDMVRTRHREKLILEACLAAQQSFVVDNTNPSPADRARYILSARAAGFRLIAYSFVTPMSEALRRNNLRKGKQRIPPVAVAGTFKKIQAPTKDEGFDEIHTVELTPGDRFVVI
jgi:predicted kinase